MHKALRYSPQSNGLSERAIGSLKSYFRANHNDTKWDEYLEEALYYVNLNTGDRKARINAKQPEDECQVGDFVWIKLKNKQPSKPFKDLITKKDKVMRIVDEHSVELQNNGLWSKRNLILVKNHKH